MVNIHNNMKKVVQTQVIFKFWGTDGFGPKLSNTQVLKQLGKSIKQNFWIRSSFLAGLCIIFLLYKPTLNGLLESDHPLHIHH